MHLLLPPSERKAGGGRGRSLRVRGLEGPLAEPRTRTLAALDGLVAGDPSRAAEALLLPPTVAAEALSLDESVLDSRTVPALRRYRGVLFDGLAADSFTAAEQRRAGRCVWIFSGLFGVVRGDEPVPDYRVPAAATLPGLGILATFWRPVLADVLPALLARGLVVDLRSTDYAAMWRAPADWRERVVRVRVLSPTAGGRIAVVSYVSKLEKGRLAAELVRRAAAGRPAQGRDDVVAAWTAVGGVDAVATPTGGLDLLTG